MSRAATLKKYSPEGSAAPKLPRCLFLIGKDKLTPILMKDMPDNGMATVFINSQDELVTELERPETFAIFVNLAMFPQAQAYLRNRSVSSNCFWVAVVANSLTTTQNATLYKNGFVDVLTLPVHPFNYRSRARQLLARFVKHHVMPDDVQLPSGMSRPAAQPERIIFSESSREPAIGRIRDLTSIPTGPELSNHTSSSRSETDASSKRPPVMLSQNSFGTHKSDARRVSYLNKTMPHLAPVPKLFNTINSKSERQDLLHEAQGRKCVATLWTPQQKWKAHFSIQGYDANTEKLLLGYPSGSSSELIKNIFDTMKVKHLFISVPLGRTRIFFTDRFVESALLAGRFELKSPAEMFQTQRRSHFRLAWSEPAEFKVALTPDADSKPTEFMISDLSANGCQLILGKGSHAFLKRGKLFSKISFDIYKRRIECMAVVRWIKGNRVGLQFVQLSNQDEEGIQLFVLEESYDYLRSYVVPDAP